MTAAMQQKRIKWIPMTINLNYTKYNRWYINSTMYYLDGRAKQELQMQSPGILQLVKLLWVVRPCL